MPSLGASSGTSATRFDEKGQGRAGAFESLAGGRDEGEGQLDEAARGSWRPWSWGTTGRQGGDDAPSLGGGPVGR
jgi:hypothetical protein